MKKTFYIIFALITIAVIIFISSFFFQKDALSSITFGALGYPAFSVEGKSKKLSDLNSNAKANLKFYEESKQTGAETENMNEKTVKKEVLQSMIESVLAEKLAKEYGISISDQEIRDELNKVVEQVGNEEQLKSNLDKMFGWTIEDFKNNIVKQQTTEQKLKNYITSDENMNHDQISKINDILQKAKSGENFEELAKQNSDCPSKEQGGDLGFFSKTADDPNNKYLHMVPEFEQAAFALESGQISEVVKTQFGWHIIKLEEKKTDENGIMTVKARHILVKPAVDFNIWFNEKKNAAKVKIYLRGYEWTGEKVIIK